MNSIQLSEVQCPYRSYSAVTKFVNKPSNTERSHTTFDSVIILLVHLRQMSTSAGAFKSPNV